MTSRLGRHRSLFHSVATGNRRVSHVPQAYVQRKRWVKPNDRSRCIDFPGGRCNNAIKFHAKFERSVVEGSAVRPSALPTSPSQTSIPNRGVIPPFPACRGTGAQRSGGICGAPLAPPDFSLSNLNPKQRCHPDRSAAKWRDLLFIIRTIKPEWKRHPLLCHPDRTAA
jgi:hypothetical protein